LNNWTRWRIFRRVCLASNGSETWKQTKKKYNDLQVFVNNLMPPTNSTNQMAREDQQLSIMDKNRPVIHHKHHQWTKLWLDRTHSEATQKQHHKTSSGQNPQDKIRKGRPTTTWRRTINAELKMCNLTRTDAKRAAMKRPRWRTVVDTLCLTRRHHD